MTSITPIYCNAQIYHIRKILKFLWFTWTLIQRTYNNLIIPRINKFYHFRFVILKLVRKDKIANLPLPRRIIDYLSTPHYYSEQLLEWEELDKTAENNTSMQVIEDTRQSWNITNKIHSISNAILSSGYFILHLLT